MNSNIFIFHGTAGYPGENWFPWLKGKLEEKGYKVIVPQFPTPEGQSLKAWLDVLDNYKEDINENSIFVGHSLGGVFLLCLLERLAHPVKAAFFVGTPIGVRPILNYNQDSSFSGFDFNWDKIRNKSNNFVVFHSDNDPYVSIGNGEQLAKKLGVDLSFIPNAGHFNTKAGYTKFEELRGKLEPLLFD